MEYGKSGKICAMKGCTNYENQKESYSFYSFPQDHVVCRQWLDVCGRKDLNDVFSKQGYRSLRNRKICAQHFEVKCFRNANNPTQGLIKGSIPSLLIASEPAEHQENTLHDTEDARQPLPYSSPSIAAEQIAGVSLLQTRKSVKSREALVYEVSELKKKLSESGRLLSLLRYQVKCQRKRIDMLKKFVPRKKKPRKKRCNKTKTEKVNDLLLSNDSQRDNFTFAIGGDLKISNNTNQDKTCKVKVAMVHGIPFDNLDFEEDSKSNETYYTLSKENKSSDKQKNSGRNRDIFQNIVKT